MQRACVGTYLLHRHEGPVDSHLRLPELLPQNIVRLCLTRNPRSGRGSLGSPAMTNFKQRQPSSCARFAASLRGFRLIEQLRLHWRWSFRKSQGSWTGGFEPVQHRLDAWESRVKGGFGRL